MQGCSVVVGRRYNWYSAVNILAMTNAKFRFLIILSVLCPLASAFAALYGLEMGVSLRLKSAFDAEPTPLAMLPVWLSAAIGAALVVTVVASTVGLYAFRPWGRALSLWSMLVITPLVWATGPILHTPLESALDMTSSMLYGAVLALAYWSPVSAQFERKG
jgi:hypothetical protein